MHDANTLSQRRLGAEACTIEELKATIALLKQQSQTAEAGLEEEQRRHKLAEERARESVGDKAEVTGWSD